MATLVNTVTPYLRVFVPDDGGYVQFQGGKLEIEEGDYGYDEVMAEAQANPSISILVNAYTCPYCGANHAGKGAAGRLQGHIKQAHFDKWEEAKLAELAADHQVEIKARAGHVCDVCRPVQTFGTEDELALHVAELHTAPPTLDADGNEIGGTGDGGDADRPRRRPGEVDAPAAARKRAPRDES